MMVRICVFGPGNISHRFMKGMAEVKGAEVTAFCNRNAE